MCMIAGVIRGLLKRCPVVSLLLFVVALASDARAESFREGVAAYKAENYTEAYRIWFGLAGTDHILAQYNVAMMYLGGHGVEQDHGQAVVWFRRAAEKGFAPAHVSLAGMFQDGLGTRQDFPRAFAHLVVAVDALPPGACRELAIDKRDAISDFLSSEERRSARDISNKMQGTESSVLSVYSYSGGCFDSVVLGGGIIRTVARPPEYHVLALKRPASGKPDRAVAADTLKRHTPAKEKHTSATNPARTAKAAGGRAYYVQIGALPTNTAARRLQARVRKRHADLLGEHKMHIRKARVPPLGTVFRVRIGPFGKRLAADGVCRALRDQRQACYVVRRAAAS